MKEVLFYRLTSQCKVRTRIINNAPSFFINNAPSFFLIKNSTLNKWVDEKVGLHILEKENTILAEGVVPAERELQEENPDKVGG